MKSVSPAVSVVMPLYNKELEVARAIQSVLAQTFFDFELIVVDDGSTDGGPAVVQNFSDSRIRIISQENSGVSAARNRGITEAKADLIAFLDADDEWFPEFLETIFRLKMNFPKCAVFATNYLFCEANARTRPTIIKNVPPSPWEGVMNDYFSIASISDPPIWSSAVAVNTDAIRAIGGFPVGIKVGEDLLTWARLSLRNDIAYCASPKAIFHIRHSVHGMPLRLPDEPDIAGRLLEELLPQVTPVALSAFTDYLGLWYRMRASVYFRAGKIREGRCEFKKMTKFASKDLMYFVYLSIASSPQWLARRLISGMVLLKKISILQKVFLLLRYACRRHSGKSSMVEYPKSLSSVMPQHEMTVLLLSSGYRNTKFDSFNLGDVAQQQHAAALLRMKLPGWKIVPAANSVHESELSCDVIPDATIISYLSASGMRPLLIRRVSSLVRCTIFLANVRRAKHGKCPIFLGSAGDKALSQLLSANLLFVAGAGNIHDGYMTGVGLFWCLMVLASKLAGIPAVLIGQQVGPLQTTLSRSFAGLALRKGASFLGVRDLLSYKNAMKLGVPKEKVFLTGDEGWHLEPATDAEATAILKSYGISGSFIAVQFRLDENNPWMNKLPDLASQLDQLAAQYSLPIVFVPFFSSNGRDDRAACNLLASRLSAIHITIDPGFHATLAKSILAKARFAVGVANHFCVFAASMGVPTIALHATPYMEHKLQGLRQFCDHVAVLSCDSLDTQGILVDRADYLERLPDTSLRGKHINRLPQDYLYWLKLLEESPPPSL